MLDYIEVKGKVVTTDSLHYQREMCAKIIDLFNNPVGYRRTFRTSCGSPRPPSPCKILCILLFFSGSCLKPVASVGRAVIKQLYYWPSVTKTIGNDIVGTDRSFGFNSALGIAAELLARGSFGRMVALTGNKIGSVDLSVPSGKTKTVPRDHYMIDTALSVGACMGE